MPRNLIHANAIVDYRGVLASPGAVLFDESNIIGVGTPQEIGVPGDASLTQIDSTVTPSFVNTHTHIDLSGYGAVPSNKSLHEWVEDVVFPLRCDSSSIEEVISKGVALLRQGGTSLVGDIAGSLEAADLVDASELEAIVFLELLGTGGRQKAAIEQLHGLKERYGVEPHAPYSCGLEVFQAAFDSGRQIATHLAETEDEIEFAKYRTGATSDFLKRIGIWNEDESPWGCHPIDAILDIAGDTPFIAAHLNYVEDQHLQQLAESNCTVAYCPRASSYFGHTNHRWQEMLEAGIRVSIGTDSMLCLDTPDRISVIDELRFLSSQGTHDPRQLIEMGTVNGAVGLGFDPSLVTLDVGRTAGLLAFDSLGGDPLLDILSSNKMPYWL